MNDEQIIGLLISHGYKKKQYGYVRKNSNNTKQAVTLFDGNKFQLFGWYKNDDEKLYSTGIIKIADLEQLTTLLIIFNQYTSY